MRTKQVIAMVFLLVVMAGCACEPVVVIEPTPDISRYVDREAGVVCWLYNKGYDSAGISCLPISQTQLDP